MFVSYLYVDDRDDETFHREGENVDSLSEILKALDRLDGDRRPLLLVAEGAPMPGSGYPFSGMAMEVASGPEGYTCTVYTPDGEETFALLSDSEDVDGYRTISRPYPDQIPASEVVDKNDAIKALDWFAECGGMTPDFKWKKY